MPALFSNNASATLASSITTSTTTVTVSTGQGALFPAVPAGSFFYATLTDSSNNLEIVKVTSRTSDVLTVVRAQEGTTARAYAAADRIEIRVTAAVLNNFVQLDGDQTIAGVKTFTTPLAVASGGTGGSTATGTGSVVRATSPTLTTPVLVTPDLGTPSAAVLTSATGLPLTTGVTGTLPVANGGTGATTLAANNVLLGNGTSAVQTVAPGTSGNVLTSNGTTWASAALPAVPVIATGAGTVTSGNSFTATTGSTGKCMITISAAVYSTYGSFGYGTVYMIIGGVTRASQTTLTMEYDNGSRLTSSTPTISFLYTGTANSNFSVTYSYSGPGSVGTSYYTFIGT